MKTCSLYGFILAISIAVLTLVLYFLGLHSDPARLTTAKWVGGLAGFAISVAVTVIGIKARRAEVPESEEFGYGRALGAGVLISVVASVLGAIFNFVYMAYINPGYSEVLLQDQMDKLQAKGLSAAQLDQAEKMTRMFMGPLPASLFGLLFGVIFGVVIALVLAAFLKRPAQKLPPPVQA
jgi:hypothetical protein